MNRRTVLIGATSSIAAAVALDGNAAAAANPSATEPDRQRAADAAAMRAIADMAVIQNLLAGSTLSADTGDTAYQNALYAEDAVMDVGGGRDDILGRAAIVAIITDDAHAALRAQGLAHIAAMPQIRVSGSRAVAAGYLQIMMPDSTGAGSAPQGIASSGKWETWRLTANRWEFEFREDRWQITRRTIRPAPSTEALELLRLA